MTYSTRFVPGFAAIGFATAIVGANVVIVPAGLPRTGTATGTVAAFFATHFLAVGFSVTLGPTAWVAAVLFAAGVVETTWRRAPESGLGWALVGFAGILLQNVTFAAVTAIRLALASMQGVGSETLWPLHDALFTLNGTFLALALLGLTRAGQKSGLVAAWHAAVGLKAAALLFGSATLAPLVVAHDNPLGLLGLAGWLLWVVWLVAYGVALLRADYQ